MTTATLTRFAPAPTGLLHLGHVVNAVFVWGLARRLGARVLLRVEDHDCQRSRPEFERQLLDDLDWLGFIPDLFPPASFRAGPCESRQSNRGPIYAEVAARLAAEGLIYGCTCTRQSIADRTGRADGPYPGTCRDSGVPPGDSVTWRVRLDPGEIEIVDRLRGQTRQDPAATHGDVAIRDRRGNWTYMFAVVVDDAWQEIDLVVRGEDLFEATGTQVALARLIGRQRPPVFAHHPVVRKANGRKLSKADSDTGISELARRGESPAQVIGRAARLAGLIDRDAAVPASAAADLVRPIQLASG